MGGAFVIAKEEELWRACAGPKRTPSGAQLFFTPGSTTPLRVLIAKKNLLLLLPRWKRSVIGPPLWVPLKRLLLQGFRKKKGFLFSISFEYQIFIYKCLLLVRKDKKRECVYSLHPK